MFVFKLLYTVSLDPTTLTLFHDHFTNWISRFRTIMVFNIINWQVGLKVKNGKPLQEEKKTRKSFSIQFVNRVFFYPVEIQICSLFTSLFINERAKGKGSNFYRFWLALNRIMKKALKFNIDREWKQISSHISFTRCYKNFTTYSSDYIKNSHCFFLSLYITRVIK